MRLLRNVLLALIVIAVAASGAGYVLLRQGLAADRPPGRLETAVARRIVMLAIPAGARAASNPRATDPNAWRAGADHFAKHCAVCHGGDGRGDSAFGPKMYPPVPDLTSADIQAMSDGALFAVIQHGVRWTGMPAFRAEHDADETWALVSFIRHSPEAPPAYDRSAHDHVQAQSHDGKQPHDGKTVSMDGTTFTPREITVKVGETVTWTNKDPFPHNVTSSSGSFSSGDLDPDRQWQFRAANTGRFTYVCTLHPGMDGTLIVEP